MATFFANLDLDGTGGAGSLGDPWRATTFKSQLEGLPADSTVKLKGRRDYGATAVAVESGTRLENWEAEPWRIKNSDFFTLNGAATITNGIIESNELELFAGAIALDCYIRTTTQQRLGSSNDTAVTVKGSTLISPLIRNLGSGTYRKISIIDSIIDCTSFTALTFGNATTDNCIFTKATLPDGTHTDYQVGWTPPTWPAWDASQSAFNENLLYTGIATPPQPGNSPYTGYERGLWDSTRNGIGAMDFISAASTTTTTTSTTPAPTTTTLAPAWPPTRDTVRERATSDGGPGARSASYDANPAKRITADYHAPWWLR